MINLSRKTQLFVCGLALGGMMFGIGTPKAFAEEFSSSPQSNLVVHYSGIKIGPGADGISNANSARALLGIRDSQNMPSFVIEPEGSQDVQGDYPRAQSASLEQKLMLDWAKHNKSYEGLSEQELELAVQAAIWTSEAPGEIRYALSGMKAIGVQNSEAFMKAVSEIIEYAKQTSDPYHFTFKEAPSKTVSDFEGGKLVELGFLEGSASLSAHIELENQAGIELVNESGEAQTSFSFGTSIFARIHPEAKQVEQLRLKITPSQYLADYQIYSDKAGSTESIISSADPKNKVEDSVELTLPTLNWESEEGEDTKPEQNDSEEAKPDSGEEQTDENNDPNDAESLSIEAIPDVEIDEGNELPTLYVKTSPNDLEIVCSGLPKGSSFNAEDRTISGTPVIEDWKEDELKRGFPVLVTASKDGKETQTRFTIQVRKKAAEQKPEDTKDPNALSLKNPGDKKVIEHEKFPPFVITFAPDSALLRIHNLPNGVSYDSSSRNVFGPAEGIDWKDDVKQYIFEESRTFRPQMRLEHKGAFLEDSFAFEVLRDTDKDGVPDVDDSDDDGDGYKDQVEEYYKTNPKDPNSFPKNVSKEEIQKIEEQLKSCEPSDKNQSYFNQDALDKKQKQDRILDRQRK
ncbi:MAG: hypothetical protein Q4E22_00705 [Coriobacteriia bacterium]|nr:hypothetical protein [Coriobacteriia bacterium]